MATDKANILRRSAPPHKYIKDNDLYLGKSDLSNSLMAEIMDGFAGPDYSVSLFDTGSLNAARLSELQQSEDMFLAHLRIKKDGDNDWKHSVMVSGIDFVYDNKGKITGISAVQVANPWNGSSYTGKTSYTLDQIDRWDIFLVKQKETK